MDDYKLDAETLEAALQKAFELGGQEDGSYHLEADEIEQVIRAAAPDVQGEPVTTWMGTDWAAQNQLFAQLAHLEPGTDLYIAPQPAEQQPAYGELVSVPRETLKQFVEYSASVCKTQSWEDNKAALVAALYRTDCSAQAAEQQPVCLTCSGSGIVGHSSLCPECEPKKPECGCCGRSDKCDDDCDAVVIGGNKPAPDVDGLEHEVRAMVGLLANGEWAGTHPRTDLGAALECQITKLVDRRATPDVARLVEALEAARQFIVNGIEVGAVRMPDSDTPDPAHNTLPMIDAALAAHRKHGGEM